MQILPSLRAPAILAAGLLASCANVTFIGHERAYDLNVAVKADLTSPVATNLGFESKTGLAVPPKEASLFADLFTRRGVHEGDVLPTISRLSAKKVPNSNGKMSGMDYMSVIATGNAAVLATAPRGTQLTSASPAPAVPAPPLTPEAGGNDSEGSDSFVKSVSNLVTKQ